MTPLLRGITVLELSAIVMGPFACQILADLGAEVIKVEPLSGDLARAAQPQAGGSGALFVNNNRNKRAIALDLKSGDGLAVVRRLVARSDVLFHNMRPDAMERLGLGFAEVSAINANIVYCSAIGFGQGGRYRDRPAFDDVIQAASGIAGLSQAIGAAPAFVPTILADKVGALYAVYGVLAALLSRERGREGPIEVEAPMFEALVSFVLNEHLAGATFGQGAEGLGYERVLARDRRPFQTLDGWVAVLPYTTDQWTRFLRHVDRDDVLQAPWFGDPIARGRHYDQLYGALATAIGQRSTSEWVAVLEQLDIPYSRVSELGDLLCDPHLEDVGFFDVSAAFPPEITRSLPQPVCFKGLKAQDDQPPPRLGADTRAVLSECGYTEDETNELLQTGVAA